MKFEIVVAAAAVGLGVIYFLDQLNPLSLSDLEQEIAGQDQHIEATENLLESVAPLAPDDVVVSCMDMDKPGVKIGRFCRHFGSSSVNLRATDAIPVAALRLLPNLSKVEAIGARWNSLAPLQEFTGVTSLYLSNSTIGDLSGLRDLDHLETLDISDTKVDDLSLISGLHQIKTLSLAGLEIADLSPLQGLSNLQQLNLSRAQLVDLTPLENLESLKVLDIRVAKIDDLSPLDRIEGLVVYR